MRIDISFLPALATAFMLTFARVGAMVMLLPDFKLTILCELAGFAVIL